MNTSASQLIDELDLFGVGAFARAATHPFINSHDRMQWRLQKNCSLSPRRLAACLAWFSLPGLLAGLTFFALGAPMILVLLVLQGTTMVWCFVQYARHAADREWLTVSSEGIEVHIVRGATEYRSRFSPAAVSLELLEMHQNLIAISESGRSVRVGSCLPMHLRPHLFQSLCHAARRFH